MMFEHTSQDLVHDSEYCAGCKQVWNAALREAAQAIEDSTDTRVDHSFIRAMDLARRLVLISKR